MYINMPMKRKGWNKYIRRVRSKNNKKNELMNVQNNRSGSNNNNLECKTDFGERNEQN